MGGVIVLLPPAAMAMGVVHKGGFIRACYGGI